MIEEPLLAVLSTMETVCTDDLAVLLLPRRRKRALVSHRMRKIHESNNDLLFYVFQTCGRVRVQKRWTVFFATDCMCQLVSCRVESWSVSMRFTTADFYAHGNGHEPWPLRVCCSEPSATCIQAEKLSAVEAAPGKLVGIDCRVNVVI